MPRRHCSIKDLGPASAISFLTTVESSGSKSVANCGRSTYIFCVGYSRRKVENRAAGFSILFEHGPRPTLLVVPPFYDWQKKEVQGAIPFSAFLPLWAIRQTSAHSGRPIVRDDEILDRGKARARRRGISRRLYWSFHRTLVSLTSGLRNLSQRLVFIEYLLGRPWSRALRW